MSEGFSNKTSSVNFYQVQLLGEALSLTGDDKYS